MTVINYLLDEDSYLEEYDETGTTTVLYTNKPTVDGNTISETKGVTTNFYHFDIQGSTSDLTAQDETVIDTFEYDAWGNEIARTGTTPTPLRYIGEYGNLFEQEINDYFMQVSIYNPTTGRRLSNFERNNRYSMNPMQIMSIHRLKTPRNNPLLFAFFQASSKYASSNVYACCTAARYCGGCPCKKGERCKKETKKYTISAKLDKKEVKGDPSKMSKFFSDLQKECGNNIPGGGWFDGWFEEDCTPWSTGIFNPKTKKIEIEKMGLGKCGEDPVDYDKCQRNLQLWEKYGNPKNPTYDPNKGLTHCGAMCETCFGGAGNPFAGLCKNDICPATPGL